MRKYAFPALCALIVLVLLAVAGRIVEHRRSVALAAAHDSVTVALAVQRHADSLAAALTARADREHALALAAEQAADSLARREAQIVARYTRLASTAPDTCTPVIAAADSALAMADERADSLQNALQSEKRTSADLRVANDSLRAAAGRLRAATTLLDRAARPSWRERLTPRLGLGAAAGVNPVTGRPAVAAGLTLGWSF